MAKEICISTTPHETRLAILEDEQLAEIYYERENEYTLAGSIYKGRVTRVLPGMQSSFVDVGLERDAFLYVTDFLEEQEDSEEYAAEGNGGGRREARSHADEPQPAAERGDRGGDREASREGNRGGERGEHGERSDRGDRGDRSRRPAAPAPQLAEAPREGGRAGRERVREQAAAPLREAVPAAQDLEEKGDEESPAGTRRWRGRRGRRRGVRVGLNEPSRQEAAPVESPGQFFAADAAEELEAAPYPTPERGAPGGIAELHASGEIHQQVHPQEQDVFSRAIQPEIAPREARGAGRDAGRERGGRRTREPYAQASTLDRGERSSRPSEHEPAAPAASGAIVLPGESLSKYGSAPAEPGTTTPITATVPKPAGRPVNYVAPKPSTLVELSAAWDGGAVMPGESLSRYRGGEPNPAAPHASPDEHSDEHANSSVEEMQASWSALSIEPLPAVGPSSAPLAEPDTPNEVLDAPMPPDAGLDQVDAPAAKEEPAEAAAEEPARAEPMEPEFVTESVSPTPEPTHVAKVVIEHMSDAADPDAAPEATEYEPENASASYRVNPTGASELRIASVDEQAPAALITEQAALEADDHVQGAVKFEDAAPLAEPMGQFADAAAQPHPASQPHSAAQADGAVQVHEHDEPVPALEGEFAPVAEQPMTAPEGSPAHELTILHEDGGIETLPMGGEPTGVPEGVDTAELAAYPAADPIEAHGFEFEDAAPALPSAQGDSDMHSAPSQFSEMVDRLQGFAPGHGLLEEETIDEEEYDFEPLLAHSDEHDQEDLEEETLDHQMEPATLSDAVRDSYLEQRVHHTPEASRVEDVQETGQEDVQEAEETEEEGTFGFIEIDEEEDEPEETAPGEQGGEAQRSSRGDDRGRGRGGRSSGGRNAGGRRGGPGRGRSAQTQDLPIITDLLKQGQEILVQIAKEPIAKKGARITSHIALPGRFLVFMPTVSHVGVSRKIASDEERQRLKRILIHEKGESSGGFIVRTAAENASEEDLRADLRFLISLWTEIKQRSDAAKAPALIYHDLNLIERILRDQVSSNFSTIWVDSEAEYERIIRFLNRFQPQLVRRVKLYTKETPLFEHFGIQEEISKALKSKVWLKSGGSIVINQTEALVAIDINTGKYVGKTARLEDTIVKTNLDAIPEIVRQIRLRDLGGIIVIDFIDMDERKNRHRVLAALEEELKHDRAPSKVLQFNDFGLVAITRKRVKQSLERTLSVQCEVCTGTGMVKSPITVCNEIYIEMRKMIKHLDGKDVMLRVHPEVVKQLKAGNGKWINELEEMVGKTIIIKSDPALHPEQFDIH